MKPDEIIEIARQAGIVFDDKALPFYAAFAKLVDAKATAKEREACAEIADKWSVGWPHPSTVIAEEIRARGEA